MSKAALPPPLPPPAPAVPEAATPVLAPRLAQPSLAIPAHLSPPPAVPLPAPALQRPRAQLLALGSPLPQVPALHTLSSSLPRGLLPLASRPHCPPGALHLGEALRSRARPKGLIRDNEGFPPPDSRQPFLQPLPPLSARGEGASLSAKGPRPWHPVLTRRPRPSGAPPGRVRGQLCPSTSRAHTLPATPWIAGREGSGGRNTTPSSPWNSPRGPGALGRAG